MTAQVSKKAFWGGWVLSILPVLMLLMSATMKFLQPPEAVEGFEHLGYPLSVSIPLGVVELGCAIVYLIPQTSVLGAILLTGYLGGATASHVRVEEAFYIPIALGVMIWLGLYLRDPRLRRLVPLRDRSRSEEA
ncbi:MAG: DoxX family protein [Candidatus Omnitrophica bacterium]|nr:DoxX family protein [Candidatus Omnitrophota bacterium]MCA9425585.1 DoxX family protein [Candidatus Omnitrophota bacterium]MCA9431325.1 DoxX family protein [Candidatus Omnitrophota bacterium]MCA9435845.1 DoxX family protein [Candidatus Omnitrophota bacterium]MCA9441924.1 DoxX family protein [Candidatus Omnitrophota bacterium]